MEMKTNQCYPRYGYDSKKSNQDRGLHMCDPLVETPEEHGRLLELLMLLFSCGKNQLHTVFAVCKKLSTVHSRAMFFLWTSQ